MKVGSLFVYRLAVFVFDILFRFTGGLKSVGDKNVPATGGVIIAPVHLSTYDPPALACTMRHRRLLAMAKVELFKNKFFGWIITQIGAFPIRRGESDREAIRFAVKVLEAGETLLVFPEGTRGDGEHLGAINSGPAVLAQKSGAWVVPVGIVGTHIAFSKDPSKKRRHGVVVAYGKPFKYADLATGANERENRALFLTHLESEIIRLCNENGLPIKTAKSIED